MRVATAAFVRHDTDGNSHLSAAEMRCLAAEEYPAEDWDDAAWEPMCEHLGVQPGLGLNFEAFLRFRLSHIEAAAAEAWAAAVGEEGAGRDAVSHFLLRLASCRNEEHRRWFVDNELQLFRCRFDELDIRQKKQFMRSAGFDENVTDATDAKRRRIIFQAGDSHKSVAQPDRTAAAARNDPNTVYFGVLRGSLVEPGSCGISNFFFPRGSRSGRLAIE